MLVAIKKLKKERVILNRDDLLELKVVSFSNLKLHSFIYIDTLKEVQAIRTFAEDIKVFWH